jgi:hypothetical protein
MKVQFKFPRLINGKLHSKGQIGEVDPNHWYTKALIASKEVIVLDEPKVEAPKEVEPVKVEEPKAEDKPKKGKR